MGVKKVTEIKVYPSGELKEAFKKVCARNNMSMNSCLLDCIRQIVDRDIKNQQEKDIEIKVTGDKIDELKHRMEQRRKERKKTSWGYRKKL